MAWVRKDLKDHLVPKALPWEGTSPTRSVAQSPIPPSLGHLQGWGNHTSLLGSTAMASPPPGKEFPPHI